MFDKIFIIKTRIFPRVKRAWHALLSSWLARFLLLLVAAFDGLLLAKYGGFLLMKMGLINLTIASNKQLAILLMSLPVLFALWLFRTFDTREQIQKTQENAEAAREGVKATREALNADTLGRYLSMLFSESLSARCVGLIRLADLKRQGNFVKEIDSATRQDLNLVKTNLKGEDLSGVNLEGAYLTEADLSEKANLSGAYLRHARMHKTALHDAILKGADLQGADLTEADLVDADLSHADLQYADLSTAKNLEHATLKGAKYHPYGTKFPKFFGDPVTRGMIRANDPPPILAQGRQRR